MTGIGHVRAPCGGIPYLYDAIGSARGDVFPIGGPGQGIGISRLAKTQEAIIPCCYAPGVYGVVAQRCSNMYAFWGPGQSIHSLVVRCKKSEHSFASRDSIPDLYRAIERASGSDVLPLR